MENIYINRLGLYFDNMQQLKDYLGNNLDLFNDEDLKYIISCLLMEKEEKNVLDMENWQVNYIQVICNFFNNYCGYMEDMEIKELISIIFNYDDIKKINDRLFNILKEFINNCIINDNDNKMIMIFNIIKDLFY